MKILAPIRSAEEVEMLVHTGADELYCGLVPREWIDGVGEAVPLNRREPGPANLETLAEMKELVELAHGLGAAVHLTLNAASYADQYIPFIRSLVGEAIDAIGIDALIVADPGLLADLMEWRDDLRVHISSLAATHNRHAVRFFAELGASRVILPRQTRVDEAIAIAAAVPEMEIELFILNDGCVFEEGHCSSLHEAGPICMTDWRRGFNPLGRALPAAEMERLDVNAEDYCRWVDRHTAPLPILTPTHMPSGPCGLCAIPALFHGGVHSLKIVGREGSAYKKLRSVQQVRHVLDGVTRGLPVETCQAEARAIRGTPELCRSSYGCYYPEASCHPDARRGAS